VKGVNKNGISVNKKQRSGVTNVTKCDTKYFFCFFLVVSAPRGLVLFCEYAGAFHFDIVVFGIACRVHEFGEEKAAFFGIAIAAEHAVALVLEAFLVRTGIVIAFGFAIAKESAVLLALVAPSPCWNIR
jgi:hypothetical protein